MALRKVVMAIQHFVGDKEMCRAAGGELIIAPCQTEDEAISVCRGAEVVMTERIPFSRKVIASLDKCRMIHNIGTGYNSIDIKAATEFGICVSYSGTYCADEVAEHTFALLCDSARKITRLDRAVRAGKWAFIGSPEIKKVWNPLYQMKGQTVGIIGLGKIGQIVVPKAQGCGMKVIAYDPYLPADIFRKLDVESVSLGVLLEKSDFVCVNAALTTESKYMIGAEQLKMMKPTAYLINCARGGIIDESALYTALKDNRIAGAALDVFKEDRMELSDPLLTLDNIVMTPHAAWYSENSQSEIKKRAYEEVRRIFAGEWPLYLLNPDVKEKYKARWPGAGLTA
jgi:D-3-phosphoglycerate dehydrogenase / 2-oxoglutarate reductase